MLPRVHKITWTLETRDALNIQTQTSHKGNARIQVATKTLGDLTNIIGDSRFMGPQPTIFSHCLWAKSLNQGFVFEYFLLFILLRVDVLHFRSPEILKIYL